LKYARYGDMLYGFLATRKEGRIKEKKKNGWGRGKGLQPSLVKEGVDQLSRGKYPAGGLHPRRKNTKGEHQT